MTIKWVGSPNFDTNRKPIDRLVIHWMSGTLAGTDAQFQKKTPSTSAHYGIEDRNIHQYVKEENVAYQAGNYAINQRSIGIEHSAAPNRPASEETYQTSAELVADICKRYSIPLDRTHILKHSEIKATQCPGTIDLDKIIQLAKGNNVDNWKGVLGYLEITKDNPTLDDVKDVVGGLKARANDMEIKKGQAEGSLTAANETISTCDRRIVELEKALKEADSKLTTSERIKVEQQGQIKGMIEDKRLLNEQIVLLKSQKDYKILLQNKKYKLALIKFK